MSKHTEGPWLTHNDIDGTELLISEDESKTIAHVFTYEHWPLPCKCGVGVRRQGGSKPAGWEEGMANARLIAAAPEMLAMLKQWVESMDCHCNLQGLCMTCETEKLIAKVEGA